jgi:gamma-glutamylcyclotransferase (GGCT)/AIG2-like uncharacterized protein YtfP
LVIGLSEMQGSNLLIKDGSGTWPTIGPYDIFVYGTLIPGGFYWQQFVSAKATTTAPAMVRGHLFYLPHKGYPALVCAHDESQVSSPWVHGFLHRFERRTHVLALDALEGYSPENKPTDNEYQRCFVHAFDSNKEPLGPVWTYEMSIEQVNRDQGKLIADGKWLV